MVANSAGGFTFAVNDWTRLDRFLILGCEGNSYYATEQKLSIENAKAVVRCIQQDGVRVVNRLTEISQAGRAPKNDPALFVLALCSKFGDLATKHAAFEAFGQVVRIGTHLFKFVRLVLIYFHTICQHFIIQISEGKLWCEYEVHAHHSY